MTPEGGAAGDRTEVEATLLVAPEGGEELAAEVAGVEDVAGYRVRRRAPSVLEDLYFDTPGDELGRRGFALRLRRTEGAALVAVKGDELRLPDGAVRRLELERRWSGEALAEIGEVLSGRGIEPPAAGWPGAGEAAEAGGVGPGAPGAGEAPPSGDGDAGPAAALEGLGFVVVQRRRTLRRRGAIEPPDGDGPVAELAVDRVGYRLRSGRGPTVVHREVEVEGAGAGSGAVVSDVSRGLRRRFGGALRPWRHDKLATGRALDHLAEAGELDALVGPDGEPTDRAYARIDALLAEGGQDGTPPGFTP